jgi:hypothetical protein
MSPLRSVHSAAFHLVGPSSYSLCARPEDDGAMWPALATRCRRALPERLEWAAALLDPVRPLAVICGEEQVREFFHWLQGLPNTERVSIGCERRGGVAPRRADMDPVPAQYWPPDSVRAPRS